MSFLDVFKKKKSPVQGKELTAQSHKVKPIVFPTKKNGHPIAYAYALPFTSFSTVNIETDILKDCEKFVSAIPEERGICLSYNGVPFGIITDMKKSEMLSDWCKKNLPFDAILRADGKTINLRFYKDKRMGNEFREQTVVSLTGFRGSEKQEMIELIEPGEEIILEENYDKEDAVDAFYQGVKIGSLPKKIALRFLDEGAYGTFYEKSEELENDDEIILKPIIRIYW